jgi:hypothetical protein
MRASDFDFELNRTPPPESPESNLYRKRPITQRLSGFAPVFLFVLWVYMNITEAASWAIRLTMCALFCSLIYLRDHSSTERWLAIGIIAVGTMLSILVPLAGKALATLLHLPQ